MFSQSQVLLGNPGHALANYNWTNTELRIARDGQAYSFHEFELEMGGWAEWCWERALFLYPVKVYSALPDHLKSKLHCGLLRSLCTHNLYLKGRKVLTNSNISGVLPENVQQLIAAFLIPYKDMVRSMTYAKRKIVLTNKALKQRGSNLEWS